MSEIILSGIERVMLIEALTNRQKVARVQSLKKKHQRAINEALSKVYARENTFTFLEKLMCRSCLVEHLPPCDNRIAIDIDPTSLFSMRNLREFTERMDLGKDLLVKFGYKNGRYFPAFDFSYRYGATAN